MPPSLSANSQTGPAASCRRILFVCMGNICRSPAAEGFFRHIVRQRGLDAQFEIDSAGTIGPQRGHPPDSRMRAAARERGYALDGLSRQVKPRDLEAFDLLIAMDRDNLFHLHSLDREGRFTDRIKLLSEFHPDRAPAEVPDPYYGGTAGFDATLDIIEQACFGLLKHLTNGG